MLAATLIEGGAAIALQEATLWVAADDRVVGLDATNLGVVHEIAVEGGANGIAVGKGALWVTHGDRNLTSIIDLRSMTLTAVVGTPSRPVAPAPGVVPTQSGTLFTIEPDGTISAELPLGSGAASVAVCGNIAMVALFSAGEIVTVDLVNGVVIDRSPVGANANGVVCSGRVAWVTNSLDSTVVRVAGGRVTTTALIARPVTITTDAIPGVAPTRVFVASFDTGVIHVFPPDRPGRIGELAMLGPRILGVVEPA